MILNPENVYFYIFRRFHEVSLEKSILRHNSVTMQNKKIFQGNVIQSDKSYRNKK